MKSVSKTVIFLLLFICALLFCIDLDSTTGRQEESGSKYWWQIEIVISAAGEYEYRKDGNTAAGKYAFDILLAASMERDNGDYLLYKGGTRIEKISWDETRYDRNGVKKVFDLSEKIAPAAELYYVMRREGKIHFDYAISSIPLPFGVEKPALNLILPRSAENETINPKAQYNSGIVNGSNVVEVLEAKIYREKEMAKEFNWSWGRKGTKPPASSSHKVKLKLKIKRLEK